MKAYKDIPIFPLKSIILPGGQFPLRIFERRYLDMTRDCLKNNNGFIIALTKRDSDYISSVYDYASYVEIVDWSQSSHQRDRPRPLTPEHYTDEVSRTPGTRRCASPGI